MSRPILKKADRWPWVWAAIVTVLLVAVAGFALAYLRATSASAHAKKVADCVNSSLAARDALTGRLHQADVDRVEGQKAAEKMKGAAIAEIVRGDVADGVAMYRNGEAAFARTLDVYLAVSARLRAEQLRNPLGQC